MSCATRLLTALAVAALAVPSAGLAQAPAAEKPKAAAKGKAKKDKASTEADKAADRALKAQEAEEKAAAKGKGESGVSREVSGEVKLDDPYAAKEPPAEVKKAPAALDAPSPLERPWAKGVSEENQRAALQLFREGNALLRESFWSKAVDKYTQALKLWDHPGIHYNLALALVNLDRPIDTHEHLQAALKYGPVPLDSDKHEQALRYMVLVEKQLTKVDVRCDLAGASVKLDGRELFVGPGRYEGLITAGPHAIIATKEGYLTREISETFVPGDSRVIDVQLLTEDDLSEMRRLFSNAIPWTVLLAGVAVGGGSVGLHLGARGQYLDYDKGIEACAAADLTTGGCTPGLDLQAKKQSADTLQSLAFVGYSVGGAAIVTGAILLYVNRLQPYRRQTVDLVTPKAALVPMVGPGVGGAQLHVSF